jgi:hypothetical protein
LRKKIIKKIHPKLLQKVEIITIKLLGSQNVDFCFNLIFERNAGLHVAAYYQ